MQITLKACRINKDLTQKQVAEKLNVTPETISNWEAGKTFPDVTQITELEKIYGVTYADIKFLP